jgi:deoxyadenosine/deoxycytidine kinase
MNVARLRADVTSYVPLFCGAIDDVERRLLLRFAGKTIALEGTIAAAKTTTGHAIRKFAQARGVLATFEEESVDKELLAIYYADLARPDKTKPIASAHALQMDTLRRCDEAWRRARACCEARGVAVLDRTAWGNAVFGALHDAYGNVSDEQYAEYRAGLHASVRAGVPDHVVYLDVDPVVAFHRATRLRAKPEEAMLSLDYMYELERANFLHVHAQLEACRDGACSLVVVRNDVYRTPRQVLELLCHAPIAPFPVAGFDPEELLADPKKIRGFFARAGEYYARGA